MNELTNQQIKESTVIMFPAIATVRDMSLPDLKKLLIEVDKYRALIEEELGI